MKAYKVKTQEVERKVHSLIKMRIHYKWWQKPQEKKMNKKKIIIIMKNPTTISLLVEGILRNGNGSGSGRVFAYPNQTHGPRPATWTRPDY